MRLLRKALSICLSLAMVLAIFPALVVRAEIAELDTFTNINGTGISGVLYSDGRLVLSGNAKNGNFSLSSELKADTRLKYVDFSATTGIVTLNGGGFAGASIERFDFPESVKTVGSGLLQNCTHLKSVEFPAFLGENDATVYTSNFLKGTTALESVTIDFVMDSSIGLVMANSMLGECSPAMARAVAESPAHKVLIPVAKCGAHIAGLPEKPLAQYIADAAELIRGLL